jgi:AraC-like DNA-binding protein
MLRQMKQFDRTRPEFSSYGFTCELWVPARMPWPDRHNEIELNLLKAGSLSYLLGGHRTTIEAGKLAVFWGAIPHQIVGFDGEAPYFVVTLPLSEFLRVGLDRDAVHRILHGELLVDAATDDSDQIKFQQWERDLQEEDPANERAARLEIQARLLRFARRISQRPTATYPSAQLSRADQLACYIARNYQQPLTSRSIADANGVHPNYAMNLFRETFGTTMTHFVTEHRISHAQRLLVTTDDAILNVALAAGFQSLSRFNEAFKAACGCSPRDYRRAHSGTPEPKP